MQTIGSKTYLVDGFAAVDTLTQHGDFFVLTCDCAGHPTEHSYCDKMTAPQARNWITCADGPPFQFADGAQVIPFRRRAA